MQYASKFKREREALLGEDYPCRIGMTLGIGIHLPKEERTGIEDFLDLTTYCSQHPPPKPLKAERQRENAL